MACYGTRGDVEPCAAIGRELVMRGHDVQMVVPPDLIDFISSAGLAAAPNGPRLEASIDAHRKLYVL